MLIAAAADGSSEEVIRLLDGGVNVDATDEVRCSCQCRHVPSFRTDHHLYPH